MNNALKDLLFFMLNKNYIGGKHTPEEKAVKSKTRWLNKKEIKKFEEEYKQMINAGFFMKTKKRTGKGTDWHISLNPRKLKDLREVL